MSFKITKPSDSSVVSVNKGAAQEKKIQYVSIVDNLGWVQFQVWIMEKTYQNVIRWNPIKGEFSPVYINHAGRFMSMLSQWIMAILFFVRLRSVLIEEGVMKNMVSFTMLPLIGWPLLLALNGLKKSEQIAAFLNTALKSDLKLKEYKLPEKCVKGFQARETFSKVMAQPKAQMRTLLKTYKEDLASGSLARLILTAGTNTQLALPALIIMFLLISPCSVAGFLRSTLDDCPLRGNIGGFPSSPLTKAVTMGMDAFLMLNSMNHASFSIGTTFYIGCVALRDFLSKIMRSASALEKSLVQASITRYRELVVMQRLFNNLNEGANIPLMILDISTIGILSLFALVALHDQLSPPIILLFSITSLDCVLVIQAAAYKGAGDVNKLSVLISSKWQSNQLLLMDKLSRRVLKSLPELRVRIGSSGNYLEKMTPLISTQFTVDQTISLVLATKND